MKILVTGGCGYVGSVLIPLLLNEGYHVISVDTQWFGNYLKPNKKLKMIKSDIRNSDKIPLKGVNTIVHLANIANDPSVDLKPQLSWEVNVLATKKILKKAKHCMVCSALTVMEKMVMERVLLPILFTVLSQRTMTEYKLGEQGLQ